MLACYGAILDDAILMLLTLAIGVTSLFSAIVGGTVWYVARRRRLNG